MPIQELQDLVAEKEDLYHRARLEMGQSLEKNIAALCLRSGLDAFGVRNGKFLPATPGGAVPQCLVYDEEMEEYLGYQTRPNEYVVRKKPPELVSKLYMSEVFDANGEKPPQWLPMAEEIERIQEIAGVGEQLFGSDFELTNEIDVTPGAVQERMEEIRKEKPSFALDGGFAPEKPKGIPAPSAKSRPEPAPVGPIETIPPIGSASTPQISPKF